MARKSNVIVVLWSRKKNQSKPYQKLVNFNLSVLEPDLISICIKIGFEIINIATVFVSKPGFGVYGARRLSKVWIQEKSLRLNEDSHLS